MKVSRVQSAWVRFGIGCALVLGVAARPSSVQAFGLDDHAWITVIAAEEVRRCMGPEALSRETSALLSEENLGEDLAFLKKFTLFSHYFNPEGTLQFSFRLDSATRVAELQERLHSFGILTFWNRSEVLHAAGVILHHIQDMAVPAHVLGVTHGLDDGFEGYEVRDVLPPRQGGLSEEQDCRRISLLARQESYLETHRALARRTLDEHRTQGLRVLKKGQPATLPFAAFWTENPASGWGSYGYLGDRFGETWFVADHVDYEITSEEYRRFKLSKLRLSIDASRVALTRMIRQHGLN